MSEQNALDKAREMIKKDVGEMFADPTPVEKEAEEKASEEEEAKVKAEAEAKVKEEAEKKEAGTKLSDEEKAAKEEAEKVAEAEAKKKADKEKGDGEGEEDPELAQLRAQNKALLGEIEGLSGQILTGPGPSLRPAVKTVDKVDGKKDDGKKPEPVVFVTEENFEDVLSSAKNVNALMTKVAEVAADEGERRGYERAIRETPALVDDLTEKTVSLREAVRDFLSVNEDLVPVRQYVGVEANRLRAENPEWPLSKLFEEAGKAARGKLELSKVASEINEKESAEEKAAFTKRGAGGGGETRTTSTEDKLSPLQKEISELTEFAEGK